MTTRAMGPLAGIGWLKNAINLGRQNPKAVFGGAALIMLIALLPSLIALPAQTLLQPSPRMLFGIMALSMVGSLLMVPLMGGYLRVIDAVEHRHPVRATDVFAPYRRGGGGLRMLGLGMSMLLVYAAAVAVIVGVAGTDIATWYMQVLAAQGAAADAAAVQLPQSFGLALAVASVLGLYLSGVYAIAFGQVAMGGRTVAGALADGFSGGVKNLLPLLVLMLAGLLAWFVMMVTTLLVALLFGLIAKLVGGWLMLVLMGPLYLALLLVVYVVMFGVMYYLWRDVCGDGRRANPAAADALTA